MAWDPYSQSSNATPNYTYTPGGNEKSKLKKIVLIIIGVLAVVAVIVLVVQFSQPQSEEDKYIKSATAAAREDTPNAEVSKLKVGGGFALAVVNDPTADGQANAGHTTVFKVNADGSMKQLAKGSYFSPLDLLRLGMPLATQAKLTDQNNSQVKENLAHTCDYYNGSVPGYTGFDGTFSPDGWQIDSATLDGIEQALSDAIGTQNSTSKPDDTVICVNATQEDSGATTDLKTYISTFTLQIEFVTANGKLTQHTLVFATGPKHYRSYMLDGQTI